MQLFQLREPSDGTEFSGFPVTLEPNPHVSLGVTPLGEKTILSLGNTLATYASTAAEFDLPLCRADLWQTKTGMTVLVRERQKGLGALVHLDTSFGTGGSLYLTGPNKVGHLQEFKHNGKFNKELCLKAVVREWLPLKDTAGVQVLSDDVGISEDGEVSWKKGVADDNHTSFPLLIGLFRGASFRVKRTGDIEDAPSEFLVSWSGYALTTKVLRGVNDIRRPRHLDKEEQTHAVHGV